MPKGYNPLSKADLRERIKDIEERIKQMDRREKALTDLKKWMANRKLTPLDVAWMIREMKPKRAAKAVTSKKPLQPKASMLAGQIRRGGKNVERRGDPEFRQAIRDARLAKGFSFSELGRKLGISLATVNNWEAGRNIPHDEQRKKILKFFDLPIELGAEASANAFKRANGPAAE